jgi:3-methyladenine DNA glycosylase Mpg
MDDYLSILNQNASQDDLIIPTLQQLSGTNDVKGLGTFVLNNLCLCVNGYKYRIIEAEVYLCQTGHEDIFTHCHPQQKTIGQFYFHQSSHHISHSYREGTYRGLDITCADNNKNGYGGILIRSLIRNDGATFIGPCISVNEILNVTKCQNVSDLVLNNLNNNLTVIRSALDNRLCLRYVNTQNTIYVGPRIGLTLKKGDIDIKSQYINRNYRFVSNKDKMKREKSSLVLQ